MFHAVFTDDKYDIPFYHPLIQYHKILVTEQQYNLESGGKANKEY